MGGTSTLQGTSGATTSSATVTGSPAPTTVTYYSWGGVSGIPTTANIIDVATTGSGSSHYAWALASDGTLYRSLNGSTFAVANTDVTHLAASDGANVYSETAAC